MIRMHVRRRLMKQVILLGCVKLSYLFIKITGVICNHPSLLVDYTDGWRKIGRVLRPETVIMATRLKSVLKTFVRTATDVIKTWTMHVITAVVQTYEAFVRIGQFIMHAGVLRKSTSEVCLMRWIWILLFKRLKTYLMFYYKHNSIYKLHCKQE